MNLFFFFELSSNIFYFAVIIFFFSIFACTVKGCFNINIFILISFIYNWNIFYRSSRFSSRSTIFILIFVKIIVVYVIYCTKKRIQNSMFRKLYLTLLEIFMIFSRVSNKLVVMRYFHFILFLNALTFFHN